MEISDQVLRSVNAKLDEVLSRLIALEHVVASGQVQKHSRYTRSETATILGVSVKTVDRLVRANQLEAIKRNGRVRISGHSILSLRQGEQRSVVEVLPL